MPIRIVFDKDDASMCIDQVQTSEICHRHKCRKVEAPHSLAVCGTLDVRPAFKRVSIDKRKSRPICRLCFVP